MRGDDADVAASQDVAAQPQDREVRGRGARGLGGLRLNVQQPDPEPAGAASDPATRQDGHVSPALEADAPAVEDHGRHRGAAALRRGAEAEEPLALEKEVALLREEEAEARQVDLLRVLLHLGEVGPVREVGDETPGEPVLHVHAGVRGRVVAEGRRGGEVGRAGRDPVRLDVERAPDGRHLHAHERREDVETVHRPDTRGGGHGRQERQLVLPAHHAPQVEAPHLRARLAVPQ